MNEPTIVPKPTFLSSLRKTITGTAGGPVWVRFPIPILCGFLGAVFYFGRQRIFFTSRFVFPVHWTWVLAVGISLSVLIILSARPKLGLAIANLLSAVAVALLGLIFLGSWGSSLPENELLIRLFHAAIVIHLAIGCIPVWNRTPNGFWQFNRWLFWRAAFATLFSLALLASIMGAFAALKYLFSYDLFRHTENVAVLVFLFFHPLFFLSALPVDTQTFESEASYPKELEILCKYLCLPVIGVYVLILYAYFAKILSEWSLPKGGVGNFVTALAVVGILTSLLLYPKIEKEKSRTFTWLSRLFFVALIPLIGLLFVGLGVRVEAYGWTTKRYLLAALGGWELLVALGYLVIPAKMLRLVPLTLFFVGLVSSIGPWNAYRLPADLQFSRLRDLITAHGLVKDGKVQPVGKAMPFEVQRKIFSALSYVDQSSERKRLAEIFGPRGNSQTYLSDLMLDPQAVDDYRYNSGKRRYISARDREFSLNIEGFNRIAEFNWYGKGNTDVAETMDIAPNYKIYFEATQLVVKKGERVLALFRYEDIVKRIGPDENQDKPLADLVFNSSAGSPRARLVVNYMWMVDFANRLKVESLSGRILFNDSGTNPQPQRQKP